MQDLASDSDRQVFGTLGSVSLNDIVQMLSMSKRTVTLALADGGLEGKLYLRSGRIVHAETGPYEGEEAFIELLSWKNAEFILHPGIDSLPKETIAKTTEALLLCTATTLDEVARVRTDVDLDFDAPDTQPVATRNPQRRVAPRPKRLPRRRSRGPIWAAALGLGALTIVPLSMPSARNLLDPATLAPWNSLPQIVRTDEGTRRRAAAVTPDAWAVAENVWGSPAVSVPADESPTPAAPSPTPAAPPPAAPTPATGTATLTVVAEPWARVTIDGQNYGETPLGKLSLPAGEHRLTLVNDHIVGVIRDTVRLEPGQTLLRRYNFQDVGYVRIVATPWANVSVDGREVGQTPMGSVALPAGVHTIRFEHPELGSTERVVRVQSGQTDSVKVEMGASPES